MRDTADKVVISICIVLVVACLAWFFADLYVFVGDVATCEAKGGTYVESACIDSDVIVRLD